MHPSRYPHAPGPQEVDATRFVTPDELSEMMQPSSGLKWRAHKPHRTSLSPCFHQRGQQSAHGHKAGDRSVSSGPHHGIYRLASAHLPSSSHRSPWFRIIAEKLLPAWWVRSIHTRPSYAPGIAPTEAPPALAVSPRAPVREERERAAAAAAGGGPSAP